GRELGNGGEVGADRSRHQEQGGDWDQDVRYKEERLSLHGKRLRVRTLDEGDGPECTTTGVRWEGIAWCLCLAAARRAAGLRQPPLILALTIATAGCHQDRCTLW